MNIVEKYRAEWFDRWIAHKNACRVCWSEEVEKPLRRGVSKRLVLHLCKPGQQIYDHWMQQ